MDDLALFHKGKSHTPVEAPAPLAPLADTHGHLAHFTRGDMPDVLCRAASRALRLFSADLCCISASDTTITISMMPVIVLS